VSTPKFADPALPLLRVFRAGYRAAVRLVVAPALRHLGAAAAHTLMVGDDIETDVLAAQRQGLTGILVKTGKYLPATHHHASGTPDHVLDSFADLPALLDHLP
jgi:ribonucleotide monophosphatase NagD (HAD superfamily)